VQFDVPQDPSAVAAARASVVPHVLVAAAGYFTVPAGADDSTSVDAVVDAAWDHARKHGQPIGFSYLPPEADGLLHALRARGFTDGVVSVYTCLDLPGKSFADYLAAMPLRRRNRVAREMERFRAAGGTVSALAGDDASAALPVVGELEAELQRTHGFVADMDRYVALNRGLLDAFGDRMRILRADLNTEPVATATVCFSRSHLVLLAVGVLDRPEVRDALVYFNLTYAAIELAYRLGVRRMFFGPAALTAKARRGARLVPLRAAVCPRSADALGGLLRRTDIALHSTASRESTYILRC
jgi:predicted N-acyltransferase